MDRLICFSGGHSSALVAIEVSRRYPDDHLILLNHDINARVEDADIKRFKQEIADYLQTPITYANYRDPDMDQFDIALKHSAWKTGHDAVICTSRLKTEPFEKYLRINYPIRSSVTIYYGFDATEPVRIQRRSSILAASGYATDFPLALWGERTIHSTEEIGIAPPLSYSVFKHANCTGCIKGGKQHWYAVFCTRPDIWEKAKAAEERIDYSIIKDAYLLDLEPMFQRMRCAGIAPTEHVKAATFWTNVKRVLVSPIDESDERPCECVF